MSGLNKITLHNSYYSQLTVSVRTTGHTNCSGTNAAGKTSMLQLIPLFYGCPPRLLNPKNPDKLPFLDFVLPSQSSLLIYDYNRQDGACCSVLYRAPNGGIAYRFVKSTSESTFFRADIRLLLQEGKPAAEIFSHLASSDIEVSNQLTTITDYAAVIQNDTHTLKRSSSAGRTLYQEAQRFSLGGQGSSMRLTGEMTYTLLKRTKMFERLKQMVTETQFIYSTPKVPQHRNNEKLSADLKGLRDFSQHQSELKQCVQLHRERLSIDLHVSRFVRGVKFELTQLKTDIDELTKTIELSESKKSNHVATFDEMALAINTDLNNGKWTKEKLEKEINEAENQYDDWANQNIAIKEEDYARLQSFREKADEANNHYEMLIEEHSDVVAFRDSQLNEINRCHLEHSKQHQDRTQSFKDELDTVELQYREIVKKVETQRKIELQKALSDYLPARDILLSNKNKTEHKIESASLTKEETAEQLIADEKIQAIDLLINKLEISQEETSNEEAHAEKKHKALLAQVDNKARQVEAIKDKCLRLQKLCYPVDGALLSELKKNYPQWQETIGKLINPELLQRTNLSPEFLTSNQTFYGISVNLDRIESPDYCNRNEILLEQLERENTTLRIEQENLQTLISSAKKLEESWAITVNSKQDNARQLKLARNSREEAVFFIRNIKAQHKDKLYERINNFKKMLQEQTLEITRHETQYESIKLSIEHYLNSELSASFDEKLLKSAAIQAKIDRSSELLEKDTEVSETQKKAVLETYSQKCKELEIDEKTLHEAKMQKNDALTTLRTVESFGSILQEYHQWSISIWQQIPSKLVLLRETESAINKLQNDLTNCQQNHKQTMREFVLESQTNERDLREKKDLNDKARAVLDSAGSVSDGDSEIGDLAYLCHQLSGLVRDQQTLRNQVLESVHKATRILEGNAGSKISDAWDILLQSRKNRSIYPEHAQEFRLQLPEDLDTLLERHVPQIHDSLIETVKAIGGQFVEFYKALKQLDIEVDRVSRTLQEKINTDQRIASLKNIQLVLISKIHTAVEGWDDIQSFVKEWQEWDIVFNRQLPPEALELSLSRVIQLFQHANIQTDINSLVDLRITLEESGRAAVIDSNASFDDASSNGLSYLALIIIFVGMSRYLCPDTDTTLTWPIDELATLDPQNVSSLFTMLDRNNIQVFSAFPSTDYNLLQHFKNRYVLYRDKGVREFIDAPEINTHEVAAITELLNTETELPI